MKRALVVLSYALMAAGVCGVGFFLAELVEGTVFQATGEMTLEEAPVAAPAAVHVPQAGELLGRIAIPRLRLSVVLFEGTTASTLRRGAGRIEGTAFPWQPGNVGIAAHRDRFFRPLRNIRVGDEIRLATPFGNRRYTVTNTWILEPDQVHVLGPTDDSSLTLVTCYPFYYVGNAPQRFVVRAELVTEGPQLTRREIDRGAAPG
ncbi:MAG: class D sortase [Bryobacteraceae bacterium]|nr:class D sortase [Bryobacteraceae bacterium]